MNAILADLVLRYPDLSVCLPEIGAAYDCLETAFASGGKLLTCGNGGSAADGDHLVGELMKGFLHPRPVPSAMRDGLTDAYGADGAFLADHLQGALPAISLASHAALTTAFANDVSPETVYAQQVYGWGRPGDVLVAFSTSGNSPNVVQAVRVARVLGLRTIGLTGREGGRLRDLCDVSICVPHDQTPAIQERHLPIYHALAILLEERFFGSGTDN